MIIHGIYVENKKRLIIYHQYIYFVYFCHSNVVHNNYTGKWINLSVMLKFTRQTYLEWAGLNYRNHTYMYKITLHDIASYHNLLSGTRNVSVHYSGNNFLVVNNLQYNCRNTLKMSGVLESPEEDTGAKVTNILNKKLKLSPPISIDNIDRLPRVGKPGGVGLIHALFLWSFPFIGPGSMCTPIGKPGRMGLIHAIFLRSLPFIGPGSMCIPRGRSCARRKLTRAANRVVRLLRPLHLMTRRPKINPTTISTWTRTWPRDVLPSFVELLNWLRANRPKPVGHWVVKLWWVNKTHHFFGRH